MQAGTRRDVDHVRGRVVPEHTDRQHLARHPLEDVADRVGLHLPPARCEDESERVGAQRHREQGVVLVGDPADLDEHAPSRRLEW